MPTITADLAIATSLVESTWSERWWSCPILSFIGDLLRYAISRTYSQTQRFIHSVSLSHRQRLRSHVSLSIKHESCAPDRPVMSSICPGLKSS